MDKTDHYFKKNLDFWHDGVSLTFRVSQSLFSSHQVDTGTQRLLKTIHPHFSNEIKVLDLGCGYGPIGLTLAKRYPASCFHMIDRDALAVDYSRQNASLNGLENCKVYGSLGYAGVGEHDFDLIISNIPGKAGEPVITALLKDAQQYLKPDGVVAVVVVTPLETLVSSVLDMPGIEILYHAAFKEHVIFHYRFTSVSLDKRAIPAVSLDLYTRFGLMLSVGGHDIDMETAYGMPEFDSLDYQTGLLIKTLENLGPSSAVRVVVYNPGQGYLPAILWKMYKPENVILVSRDLLSLHFTERNLIRNGCPGVSIVKIHQTGWRLPDVTAEFAAASTLNSTADCIIGILRQDEDSVVSDSVVNQAISHIQIGGTLFIAGGSTPITRLLKNLKSDKRLILRKRRKHQGKSVAIFQRRS